MNHKGVSFTKSGLRIFGFLALAGGYNSNDYYIAGIVILVLAELLGIFEEMVEA